MIKKKYILLTCLLSLLCIDKTYAACTQEEINAFKKIEDEFKITYKFDKDNRDYKLTFKTPVQDDFDYIIYTDIKLNCKKITDEKTECYHVPPNVYDLGIIGTTKTCDDELKSITLKLARYNNFSEDPLCEGIEEFVLCQPTYDKEIDYETFQSRVNTYKKNQLKQENKDEIEEKTENEFINYIKNNLMQIIIIITFLILVIITTIITIKSIRKSRRLE